MPEQDDLSNQIRIGKALDGDTVKIEDQDGNEDSVRVTGFDSPETDRSDAGASAATAKLKMLKEDESLEAKPDGRDRYGRILAALENDQGDVADQMIRSGSSVPYTRFADQSDFKRASSAVERRAIPGLRTEEDKILSAESRMKDPTFNAPDMSNLPGEPEGVASRALDRGVANLKRSFGSASDYIGEQFGVDTLSDYGQEVMASAALDASLNEAEVPSYMDVEGLSTAGTYALEKVVENIPNLATMAVGGVGGVSAKVGYGLVRGLSGQAIKEGMKKAAIGGSAAGSYPIHLGESAESIRAAGKALDESPSAFFTAGLNTALDVGGMNALLTTSFKGLGLDAAKDYIRESAKIAGKKGLFNRAGRVAADAAKGVGGGAAIEAPTEAMQEFVISASRAYHDPDYDLFSEETGNRLAEAAVAGGTVGGALSGSLRTAGSAAKEALSAVESKRLESALDEEGDQVETTEEPDNSQVAPESDETIDAQAEAMESEQSSRDSVLLEPGRWGKLPGERKAALQEQIDNGSLKSIGIGESGLVLTTSQEKADQVQQARDSGSVDESLINEVLFNNAGSPTKEGDAVVTSRNEEGTPVADIVVDSTDSDQVASAVEEAESQGDTTEVRTPEDALDERGSENDVTDADIIQKARDDFEKMQGGRGHDDIIRQINQLFGEREADVYRQEVNRLTPKRQNDPDFSEDYVAETDPENDLGTDPNPDFDETAEVNDEPNDRLRTGLDDKPVEIDMIPQGGKKATAESIKDQRPRLKTQANVLADILKYQPESRSDADPARQAAVTDSAEVTQDADGNPRIVLSERDKATRDLDAAPAFVRDLVESLRQGITDGKDANRVTFKTRDGVYPLKSGGPREVRVNLPALTKAGAQLLGIGDVTNKSIDHKRAAALAGIHWLNEHGLALDTTAKQLNSKNITPDGSKIGDTRYTKPQSLTELQELWAEEAQLQGRIDASEALPSETDNPAFDPGEDTSFNEFSEPSNESSEPTGDNVAGLDTEQEQNAQSKKDSFQRRGSSRKAPGAKPPKSQIKALGSEIASKWVSAATAALEKVGLTNVELRVSDSTGLNDLSAEFGVSTDPGTSAERQARLENESQIDDLRASSEVGRIMFLKNPKSPGEVVPAIFVDSRLSKARQVEVLGHELGHLVMEHTIQAAGPELRTTLNEEFGPDPRMAHERFANFFAAFVLNDGATARKLLSGKANGGAITRFVRTLKTRLRTMWEALKADMGDARAKKTAGTFKDFVEQWTGYSTKQPAPKPQSELGKQIAEMMPRPEPYLSPVLRSSALEVNYLNFETEPRKAAVNAVKKRFSSTVEAVKKAPSKVNQIWENTLASEFAVLRRNAVAYGNHLLVEHFNHESGVRRSKNAPTIIVRHEIESEMGQFMNQLRPIAEAGPGDFSPMQMLPGIEREESSAAYKKVQDVVTGRETEDSLDAESRDLYDKVRKIFDDMHKWLNDHHVRVGHRKDYFPFIVNHNLLAKNKEDAIAKMTAWAKTDQGKAWFRDEGIIHDDAAINSWAEGVYNTLINPDSAMGQVDESSFEFLSPGFGSGKRRHLHAGLIKELADYRQDDVISVLHDYIRTGVRRGVWQERFGQNEALDKINAAWDRALNTQGAERGAALSKAADLQKRFEEEHEKKHGISLYDPVAKMKAELKKQYDEGNLSRRMYERVVNVTIPSAQGRLGANMNPSWRAFQGAAMVYQNIRILSLAGISQLVDFGLVTSRAQGLDGKARVVKELIKGMANKQHREQLYETARIWGTIHDGIVQHIMNDEHAQMLASPRLRDMNEWFFRANGMQFLTNFGRSVATVTAIEQVKTYVREGNNNALSELGVEPEAARVWLQSGAPMTPTQQHKGVTNAIHQFVDESIMSPDPMTRGVVGNDQRFALIWHLHGFAWQYHNRVLMRAINSGKGIFGDQQGMAKAAAMLPALAIASMVIPAAAAAREIRWAIADNRPKGMSGWDQAWEAVGYSGILGIGEELKTIKQNVEWDRNVLLASMGPTVDQVSQFSEQELGTWMWNAAPASDLFIRGGELAGLR